MSCSPKNISSNYSIITAICSQPHKAYNLVVMLHCQKIIPANANTTIIITNFYHYNSKKIHINTRTSIINTKASRKSLVARTLKRESKNLCSGPGNGSDCYCNLPSTPQSGPLSGFLRSKKKGGSLE